MEPLLELPESIDPPEDDEPDEEDDPAEELPDDELPPPRGAADPELEPVVFGREPAWAHTAGAALSVNAAATMPMVSL